MSPVDPAPFLASLEALASHNREQWQATVCAGDPANLPRCTEEVAATCPMRMVLDCPRRQQAELARVRAEQRADARLRGVPERVLRVAFDRSLDRRPVVAEVERFMAGEASVLLLCGRQDSGKTTAAAWACLPPPSAPWEQARPNQRVPMGRFVQMADLAGPHGRLLLDDLQRYDLMVIDDIGATYFGESGFQTSIVSNAVNHAYLRCKKLILTTDLQRQDLEHLLGRRVMSHIERGGRRA